MGVRLCLFTWDSKHISLYKEDNDNDSKSNPFRRWSLKLHNLITSYTIPYKKDITMTRAKHFASTFIVRNEDVEIVAGFSDFR